MENFRLSVGSEEGARTVVEEGREARVCEEEKKSGISGSAAVS